MISRRDFLSISQLKEIEARITGDAKAGRADAVWTGVESLLPAMRRQEFVAVAVVKIVADGLLRTEIALEVLTEVYGAHPRSESLLAVLGQALDRAREVGFLNAPPPENPLFRTVVDTLAELVAKARGLDSERSLLRGLATAARMMGRQRDELVETSCRRLIELDPTDSSCHYNLGLFLKTRGRFREGVTANQTAAELVGAPPPPPSYEWNLGICATGAAAGALALEVWRRLGQRIEMGRFGLPEGTYPQCKVRLAQRPLAERTASCDDPGLEETVWLQRLSPCHGIIQSGGLEHDLGIAGGEVILFDGAPLSRHSDSAEQTPVFPHLATLGQDRRSLRERTPHT